MKWDNLQSGRNYNELRPTGIVTALMPGEFAGVRRIAPQFPCQMAHSGRPPRIGERRRRMQL